MESGFTLRHVRMVAGVALAGLLGYGGGQATLASAAAAHGTTTTTGTAAVASTSTAGATTASAGSTSASSSTATSTATTTSATSTTSATTAATTSSAATTGTRTCDVTAYGADPGGSRDSTSAVRAAIAACAASSGPNTVYFPAGTYAIADTGSGNPTLQVSGPNPVILNGAGRDSTRLVEHVGTANTATCPGGGNLPGPGCPVKSLLGVSVDGSTVENLTLDTATYNAGTSLGSTANNGTFRHLRVLHGSVASGYFPIYFPGPAGASRATPLYNTGNIVDDLVLVDSICDDSFSFSFQANATISNVQHTGSRLALYIDRAVTVTNYSYTPGSQTCGGSKQGFYITAPSSNITITGFTSSGAGGVIGPGSSPNSNIVLNDYRLTGSGQHLEVGDVSGLTIRALNSVCSFGTGDTLRINPSVAASSITVSNCSIPMVRFASGTSTTVSGVSFLGDTWPAQSPQQYSFYDDHNIPVVVTIGEGTYQNCPSRKWFSNSSAITFAGQTTLSGYPC